ncbi:MAG: 4-hydroxythreonine-4-phosphate dehydrogenase PdxA [Xanthomonadales bacterium]|nr:4-hydroxythreonine-4-phosphate dehydrogenase PdxA [Xanthomonadales bacterium]
MLDSGTSPLLVTAGEPAGIGPELIVRSLGLSTDSTATQLPLLVLADAGLIQRAASRFGIETSRIDENLQVFESLSEYSSGEQKPGQLAVLHVPMEAPETPGILDARNSPYVLNTLRIAAELCLSGDAAGLVTAPLHKGIINEVGIDNAFFSGHTEYLAELSNTPRVVMMLATAGFRVALVTTHLPLKDIAAAISFQSVTETLEILHRDMRNKFNLSRPRITVCGLNPHAGEGGHLGMEEIEIIEPALQHCRAQGMDIIGPLPADTAFTPANIDKSDVILAMYHDQGLPVLKHAGFGNAINITLGLPFIRTSVDHGTALDIAGLGKADTASLALAIKTAAEMAIRKV